MFVGSRRFRSICIAVEFITGTDYITLMYVTLVFESESYAAHLSWAFDILYTSSTWNKNYSTLFFFIMWTALAVSLSLLLITFHKIRNQRRSKKQFKGVIFLILFSLFRRERYFLISHIPTESHTWHMDPIYESTVHVMPICVIINVRNQVNENDSIVRRGATNAQKKTHWNYAREE